MSEKDSLLFPEIECNWEKEWQGMPEFRRFDNRPFQQIVVNFESKEDVKAFAKVVDQPLTTETDTIWYPKKKRVPTGVYVDDES